MLYSTWISNHGNKIHKLKINGLWVRPNWSWLNWFLGKFGTLKVHCFATETEKNIELIRRRSLNGKHSFLSIV